MKKIFAVLLALVFALGCAAAHAETDDRPIVFRGISWGTSLAELQRKLQLTEPGSYQKALTVKSIIEGVDDDAFKDKDYTLRVQYDVGELNTIRDVAGYSVKEIWLFFAFLPEGEGVIGRDDEHTALYAAFYRLGDPIGVLRNEDERYTDLVAKMTSLYGEPEMIGDRPVWHGAEGTMASIEPYAANGLGTFIYYASEIGDTLLQDLEDCETSAAHAAAAAAEEAFAANTNGL